MSQLFCPAIASMKSTLCDSENVGYHLFLNGGNDGGENLWKAPSGDVYRHAAFRNKCFRLGCPVPLKSSAFKMS